MGLEQLFETFCTCCKNEKYRHTQNHNDYQCQIYNKAYLAESLEDMYADFEECEITGNLVCPAFRLHNWFDIFGNFVEPEPKQEKNPNQLELF